jgi:hypothetical protein
LAPRLSASLAPPNPRRKVFERLKDDFASKRRERVVRIDVPLRAFEPGGAATAAARGWAAAAAALRAGGAGAGGGGGAFAPAPAGVLGLEDWDAALRDALRAGFEARQAGYDMEVRPGNCGAVAAGAAPAVAVAVAVAAVGRAAAVAAEAAA